MSFENANFKPVEAVFKIEDPKKRMIRFSSRRLYLKQFLEKLGSPELVKFYIDRENKLLAICPTENDKDPCACMVQRAIHPYVSLPLEVYAAVKPSFNKSGYYWITPEFALLRINGEEGQYLVINYSREAKA